MLIVMTPVFILSSLLRRDIVFSSCPPEEGNFFFIIKLTPGIPKNEGGIRQENIIKALFPRDNTTFLSLCRPFGGGGQHKDGGVAKAYYGMSLVGPCELTNA